MEIKKNIFVFKLSDLNSEIKVIITVYFVTWSQNKMRFRKSLLTLGQSKLQT